MSPRTFHKDKHFAEIFSNTLGFELTSYARSGFSNGGIVIQLSEAIRQKPDLILFNLTNYDRIEVSVPVKPFKNADEFDKSHRYLSIYNVTDANPRDEEMSDPFYKKDGRQNLVSGNLTTLLDVTKNEQGLYLERMTSLYPDWQEKIDAINIYHKHIYSEIWKRHVDTMIVYATLHKLELSGIPYILVHDWLYLLASEYRPNWITSKNEIHSIINEIRGTYGPEIGKDPGFHLSFEGSQKVADVLINHYNNYFRHIV